jgi:hypothetical protein
MVENTMDVRLLRPSPATPQYYANELIAWLRHTQDGTIWLVFDHLRPQTVPALHEYVIDVHTIAFAEHFGDFVLMKLRNELTGASELASDPDRQLAVEAVRPYRGGTALGAFLRQLDSRSALSGAGPGQDHEFKVQVQRIVTFLQALSGERPEVLR